MNARRLITSLPLFALLCASLTFAGCGLGQLFGTTLTPTPTITSSPTSTATPLPTATPSPTPTPTIRITTTVLYVRSNGTGQACDSWVNACKLQTALEMAAPGTDIWVKTGIYKPSVATSPLGPTFVLKEGVEVYGGFAGTETSRDQRNWETNITVLSGDLGGDDITNANGVVTDTANIVGQNAYHIVWGSFVDNTAILDGFFITAGFASQASPNLNGYGGGLVMQQGSPTLNNLVFSGNSAGEGGGGAMFISFSSNPILTHVTFVANTAGSGGGMFNDRGSNPVLNDVTFSDNQAIMGGGMINSNSSPILNDVTFSRNVATENAGGMGNNPNANPILNHVTFVNNSAEKYGGGMNNYQSSPILTDVEFADNTAGSEGGGMHNEVSSSPVLTNVTFVNNSAEAQGGGMLSSESRPTLTNVTFYGNSAGAYGGALCNIFSSSARLTNVTIVNNQAPHGSGICNVGGTFKLVNGIVWGNSPVNEEVYNDSITPDITYSDIEGGFPGEGNLNFDPSLGPFGNYGALTRVSALLTGSPVIDQGSPSICPATDQLGLFRPVDGDGNGSAICDMGAFEYR